MPHFQLPSGFQILSKARRLVRKADRVLRDVSAFEQLKAFMTEDEPEMEKAKVRVSSSPRTHRRRGE